MKNVYEKPELKFLSLKLDEIIASDGTDLGDGPSGMGGGSDIW